MIKVLFICHGNICRSTLAESVFTYKVSALGLADQFLIDSAATSTEEIGNPPHRGTVNKLREVGIPLVPHRARQITWADYDRFDYIIGMDRYNMRDMLWLFNNDPQQKCSLLMDWVGLSRDVADPWYTGDFETTYDDIDAGCLALMQHFKKILYR